MQWEKILFLIGGLIIAWFLYRTIKRNPGAFSSKNLSKSAFTMGVLALLLIGFIALMIMFLRG